MNRFDNAKIEELKKLSEGKVIVHHCWGELLSISKTIEGCIKSFDNEANGDSFYCLNIEIYDDKEGFEIGYRRSENDYWNRNTFYFTDFIENL